MKVLISGISGQLGSSLKKIFSEKYQVYGIDKESNENNIYSCDITNKELVEKIISEIKPDIVINVAALVNADMCEVEKELTYNINYLGNKNILNAAKKQDALFVFISSYYVFDGLKEKYTEEDYPTPINYYGIIKSLSENETLHYNKSIIIRPCKIFSLGYDKRNFIARLYHSLKNNEEFFTVDDQYNNPIHADFISEIIKELVEKKESGIFNVGGETYVNNYEFAKMFAEHFNLNTELIKAVKTDQAKQKCPRPKKVELLLDKLNKKNIKTYTLQEMFQKMNLP